MRYLKLTVAYRGTHYCGWQVQTNQLSVQQALENAFTRVTGEKNRLTASGRTDAGVHAIGQVVSVATSTLIPNDKLVQALNSNIPRDISVLSIEDAPERFHAIRDAKRKRYRYRIQTGTVADPLDQDFIWFVSYSLDVSAMKLAAKRLLGEHDFACFQAAGADRKSTVRTIFDCQFSEIDDGPFRKLHFEIEGNGFLYNMVRNIVGSLVEIGRGKQLPEWIAELISSKDRKNAGQTAPAKGLFLVNVDY